MPALDFDLQQQLRALYSDHHGWLLGWLRRKLGCSHHAADVAHDTFLRICSSRDALLGQPLAINEPRAYLTTTARHLLANRARRQVIEDAYVAELALAYQQCEGYPSPEQILLAVQALEQISAALDGLASRPRQAFLLHYLDGQSQSEVAAQLGVSTRMVQKYLAQALLHCHVAL